MSAINLQLALKDFKFMDDLKCLRVYLEILFNANTQKTFYKGHEIDAGELVATLSFLVTKLKKTRPLITEKMIRNILTKLERDNLITRRVIKSNKKDLFTVISVKNFNELRITQHLISFKNEKDEMGTQKGKQKNAQNVDIISDLEIEKNKRANKRATLKESTVATENSFTNKNDQMPHFGEGNKKSTILYTNSQLCDKMKASEDELLSLSFNSSFEKNKKNSTPAARPFAEDDLVNKSTSREHSPKDRGNIKNSPNDLPETVYNGVLLSINYVNALSQDEREKYKSSNSISVFCNVFLYNKILSISKIVIPHFNKYSPKWSYGFRSNKALWCILECYVLKGITDLRDYISIIDYASTLITTIYSPNKVNSNNKPRSHYFTLQTILVNKGMEYLSLSKEMSNNIVSLPSMKSDEQWISEAVERNKKKLLDKQKEDQENLRKGWEYIEKLSKQVEKDK